MYQKILLCYDGTAEGRNALKEGADVAICMHADTYLLAIIRNTGGPVVPEGFTENWFDSEDSVARHILDEGVAWLREHGVDAHGEIAFGNAIEEITRVALEVTPDLIVVGHRRRSRLERWWSDDEDAMLLDRVPCSILVAVGAPDAG
jgi:nucleotide-binding universal stress UspA family protein